MSMEKGLVSIIIPTFYRNELLGGAIESALNQKYDPVEIIVVDDSGERNAQNVVSKYDDIQYVPLNKNRGTQAARNVGLKHSKGEYVDFLDDDDRMHADKIQKQISLISSEVGVVYCGIELTENENDHEIFLPKPDVQKDVLQHALAMEMFPCCDATMLIRRDLLEEIPLLDYSHAIDIGVMIELAQRTKFDYVDSSLVTALATENTLTDSIEYTNARLDYIDKFEDLYKVFPPETKRSALARTYQWRGNQLLENNLWSLEAIRSFFYAVHYSNNNKPNDWMKPLASVFGRPGIKLGKRIR